MGALLKAAASLLSCFPCRTACGGLSQVRLERFEESGKAVRALAARLTMLDPHAAHCLPQPHLSADGEELLHAMCARVVLQDGAAAVLAESLPDLRVVEEQSEVFLHSNPRYPLLGLDIVAQKTKRLMIFQTLTMPGSEVYEWPGDFEIDEREVMLDPGWPKMAFIEKRFAHDPTNWWAANHAGVEAMLRSSGFRVIGNPGLETYLCEPNETEPSCVATWDSAEFLAATGQSELAAWGLPHAA